MSEHPPDQIEGKSNVSNVIGDFDDSMLTNTSPGRRQIVDSCNALSMSPELREDPKISYILKQPNSVDFYKAGDLELVQTSRRRVHTFTIDL